MHNFQDKDQGGGGGGSGDEEEEEYDEDYDNEGKFGGETEFDLDFLLVWISFREESEEFFVWDFLINRE